MISKKLLVAGAIAALSLANAAHATVIGTWNLASSAVQTTPVATSAPGYTLSALTAVGLTGSAFDNHFYFSGWGSAVDLNKYFQLSVTGTSGYVLNKMTFSTESTVNAPATMYVRSSADNFASNIDSFSWGNADVTMGDFDFDALGALGGTTTLRFYVTSTAGGQFGFANHECPGAGCSMADVGRDITLNGTAVPEPGAFALLGIGMIGFAAARRKNKAAAS
ncbi:PEP-CTERM sorting domain-containing protein [Massilia cavernae]|uniref:PEP-CTERM sorting domain-containing protein n=1 Tax=Massilia cavernae TaxID=2320864 RepID=A0A418XFI5_9BURK|nr:PEP-CTERM sorting domain-containing protein [Massilia cavernae]RJG11218.1 PEP-CTERM sorting domain-containing protein [Massilia cavernae]